MNRIISPGRRPRWMTRLVRKLSNTPDQLRVLHIVSSLLVGGMEHFVLRIASAQRRRGTWAGILTLRDGPLAADAEKLGVPVWSLGGRAMAGRIGDGARCAVSWMPDVMHVHNVSSLHYGALLAHLVGASLVMTFHGQGKRFPRTPTAVEWKSLDLGIAVSRAAAQDLTPYLPSPRLVVVHNGIELHKPSGRRELTRRNLGLGEHPVLITVARMDDLKGHRDLLAALARLRERGLRTTALLAGDGAERPALEALSRELELDQQWVRFLGFRSDVAQLLEAADVFVLPSLSEGLPLSMLEAMAAGLAVVSTDVGGVPEVVTNEREALLVPARAPAALAEALARVLSDPTLRRQLAQAGLERARQSFSFDGMLGRYDELYGQVLGWAGSAGPDR